MGGIILTATRGHSENFSEAELSLLLELIKKEKARLEDSGKTIPFAKLMLSEIEKKFIRLSTAK